MSEVLVLVDHVDATVRSTTAELLTFARRLGDPVAVLLGASTDAARETLRSYGADKIYVAEDSRYDDFLVVAKVEALAHLVAASSPAAVLIASGGEGKEIAGRLAIKTGSGLLTDAVDVQILEGALVATQPVFAGDVTVRSRVTRGVPVVTLKPNSVTPETQPGAGVEVALEVELSEAATTARVSERRPRETTGRPELTEAAIVVAGGRGTGGDFTALEAFADSLGAAVGASRAVVDAGWYPHSLQIGQTGKTVSPQLYVAAGISGAIQHRAGMQTSKTIVAVNKDPESPIFESVDFGVVGNLHDVLARAAELIRARRG